MHVICKYFAELKPWGKILFASQTISAENCTTSAKCVHELMTHYVDNRAAMWIGVENSTISGFL